MGKQIFGKHAFLHGLAACPFQLVHAKPHSATGHLCGATPWKHGISLEFRAEAFE